ncbi:uncharacterized protein DUF1302 [Marinobacterium halophilum]|uniref:Uncharacterized protein DUF1302 n=1 Tax=Marinobacterium halophilum TaxID=267374 RepID=A0A2P8ERC9_9GAMM|nr:DUF1302 family protein [Marinobacterium halophilum]PSL12036.1 uncharacterized protein DUF1302 [Marinobacterium halophilum]
MTAFKPNLLALAVLAAGITTQAQAGESIDMGNDLTLDWKGTVSYGAGVRLEDPSDASYMQSSGNSNFDQGDMINNRLSLLMEGRLHKGNSGLVMSASTFYDDVYQDSKFSDDAEKYHGGYTRLLDLYGYTTFELGNERYLNLRAGKHVVAWGEALFMPSMSLAQGPSDGTKSGIPGVEVKDILLPEDQVSMQLEMNPNWSILAHAQYNWHPVQVSEPGAFLSTSDAVGEGATCLSAAPGEPCGFGVRGSDIEPDEMGQWGIGTRFRTSLETEWGLYYMNYHDRIPLTQYNALSNTYQIRYFDDIQLYGATMTTSLGMASIAGEVTYKKGAPVLVSTQLPVAPGYSITMPSAARADIMQTNVNAIVNFGRSWIADTVNLTAELSYVDIMDVEKTGLNGIPGTATDDLFYSNHGLAFSSSLSLSYPGATENWDLSVPIAYSRQISGRTITGGVGGEGDHRFSVGADFTHRTGVQVGVKYLTYMGSASNDDLPYEQLSLSDRDNLSLSVKYAF